MQHAQIELHLCCMLRPWTYDDVLCVNAVVEINVLEYNVVVWYVPYCAVCGCVHLQTQVCRIFKIHRLV